MASLLLPTSCLLPWGRRRWRKRRSGETGTKNCWLANQTWPCGDTHAHARTHTHTRERTHECQSATEQCDWSWDKHLSHCQGPSRKTQAYAKGIRGARALGLNSASQPKKLLRGALRQKRLCPTSNICYALLSPQNPTYHPFSVCLHYTVGTGGSWLQTLLNSVSQSKVSVLSSFKLTCRTYWVVS